MGLLSAKSDNSAKRYDFDRTDNDTAGTVPPEYPADSATRAVSLREPTSENAVLLAPADELARPPDADEVPDAQSDVDDEPVRGLDRPVPPDTDLLDPLLPPTTPRSALSLLKAILYAR